MDKEKLLKWKYATFKRLNMMNSYYFALEPFYKKNLSLDESMFKDSLLSKNKWLYIHVPYCVTECSYCACTKMALKNKEDTKKYVEYLIKELKFFYELNWKKRLVFNTLTFGWWTPSILSVEDIRTVFKWIYEYIDKSHLTQISFECAPYTMTKEKIDLMKKVWVDRISFWIQSLDKKVLDENNRPYIPKEKIWELIEYIHELWIYIEWDLIVWIRGQSVRTLLEDVQFLLSKWVDDITFNYFSPHIFSKYTDSKETVELKERFKLIDKKLVENGQIIWSYQIQERFIRSSRRYSIIWLWYWATSNLWNSFIYVKDSLDEYYNLIDNRILPVSSWIYMDDKFEYIRYIYWEIIKWEIDIDKAKEIFWFCLLDYFSKEFTFLIDEWIIETDWKKVKLIADIDKSFVYLSVFIDDVIEDSELEIPNNLPENMDIILRQMIYDYII